MTLTWPHKAGNLLGLRNGLFLCSHPLQAQDVWQMPDTQCCVKYTSSPSQEALEEMRSQRDPTIFTFFISKPWMLPFSLILSCSPFVQGGCWFLRWKTLVWQPSKSHRTLKVTCIAELFFLHFTSNIKVMIKRIRAEGEAKRCLLWSKQQYQSPDPHEAL